MRLQIGLIHKILRFEADFRADQQFAKLLRDVAIDLDGWSDSGPSEPMHGTRLRRKASTGQMGMRKWGIQSGTQSRSRPRDCKRRAFGTKSLDRKIWEDAKMLRPASQETSLACE